MTDVSPILDMCCGGRAFWFDKSDQRAVFSDIRQETHTLCDGRTLEISPDVIADFRSLPFADENFSLVVFDPPHLARAGDDSYMRAKYGALNKETWRDDLRAGFREAFRVLRPRGTLIFKWNETHIPVSLILTLTEHKPVIGHKSGKRSNTHWICFLKDGVLPAVAEDTDPLLQYATRRIIELESMMLVDVPETVWPAEVEMVYSQVERAGEIPAHHQRRLHHHINRMWLEKMSVPDIVKATKSLVNAMENYS
ncbi:class I SAM-dependent methyltransferase [Prodigiosinella confusarubida]|uniref:Class I SAM-dependent methyltransferase n=1 Tax=Serratia sp. (strain ATCC 39006) TaxID=104623 RepID=V3TQB7_SERS3|nr:class I SAM-dependent methyltransferase [Serratia sp. ATCC 39006]AUH00884.1 class I SAM-dependent methyltransferase [Serratia sp. ATCC 39006]AUH04046.1 class I SAM-dependent methyltransferase [Serratia sp. ATCC 39006]AUH05206.1 class I SAM-dependent methyltransferase [Serratia sp. ATCC 39006]